MQEKNGKLYFYVDFLLRESFKYYGLNYDEVFLETQKWFMETVNCNAWELNGVVLCDIKKRVLQTALEILSLSSRNENQ